KPRTSFQRSCLSALAYPRVTRSVSFDWDDAAALRPGDTHGRLARLSPIVQDQAPGNVSWNSPPARADIRLRDSTSSSACPCFLFCEADRSPRASFLAIRSYAFPIWVAP